MSESKVEKATKLGRLAFERGAKCVAAHDPELCELLENNKVGDGENIPVLAAWNQAWHAANAKAPVKGLDR